MDTPISSRRRKGPRWLMETRRLDVSSGSDTSTSTPSHLRQRDTMFSPMTPSAELMRGGGYSDYDEDDMLMPSTQMFNQKRDVYWNYEASPKTRAKLQQEIAASEADEVRVVRLRPKPTTPVIQIRPPKSKLPTFSELQKDQDYQFLNQLVLTALKNESSNEEESTSANVTSISVKQDSPEKAPEAVADDPFDGDDSFLVACSQAIEEKAALTSAIPPNGVDTNRNHKFKIPPHVAPPPQQQTERKTNTATSSCNNEASVFDGDDSEEFEMLLSQIEIPTVLPTTPVPSAALKGKTAASGQQTRPTSGLVSSASNASCSKPSGSFIQSKIVQPPKPTISAPDHSKSNTTLFKRFKSADDAAAKTTSTSSMTSRPAASMLPANVRTVTSSFRRNNSEPQTPPGPLPGGRQAIQSVGSKCSKEEIECKRQEALRRRHLSSQKLK